MGEGDQKAEIFRHFTPLTVFDTIFSLYLNFLCFSRALVFVQYIPLFESNNKIQFKKVHF